MNKLTDSQRERLAEFCGVECRYGQPRQWFIPDYGFSEWLSGDLTSPDSYYQVHHILLPRVREMGLTTKFSDSLNRVLPDPEGPFTNGWLFDFISADNQTIIAALLDVLEETK